MSETARRLVGASLAVAGAALLLVAANGYASGALDRDQARREWAALEAKAAVAHDRMAALRSPNPAAPSVGVPVARIMIGRLGLDEVVVEGVDEAALNAGPGHVPGSAMPGATGNSIISGHRDRHFRRLDGLKIGDTIVTETSQKRSTWAVSSIRIVDKDAPALFHTADTRLTLTTCWPIRYLGTAPERMIVVARRIGE
jgi:sortase A